MSTAKSPNSNVTLEENLKKALSELLILHLLNSREHFIGELTEKLERNSGGILRLVFPYSAVYRLQQEGHIADSDKRIAPDGRKRQYYHITAQGREHYLHLLDTYRQFIDGVNIVLETQGDGQS